MSEQNQDAQRPEAEVQKAEQPAVELAKGAERPETPVVKAEQPAKAVKPKATHPDTKLAKAEQPAKAAAKSEEKAPKEKVKHIHLAGGLKIPVVAQYNVQYGLSGQIADVTVAVEDENGEKEGFVIKEVPTRFIK